MSDMEEKINEVFIILDEKGKLFPADGVFLSEEKAKISFAKGWNPRVADKIDWIRANELWKPYDQAGWQIKKLNIEVSS